MEFKKEKEDLNFIDSQLVGEPCVNVITKEQLEERIKKVFDIIWDKLSKSFGPGGAGTFISIYPNYYNTKDGFTIMKNIAFDKKIDQVISDMVMTICNRLNFTVGDGTTTATIATKSTYEAYLENKDFFEKNNILPRNILKQLEDFKNIILKNIDEMSVPIRSDDPKVLRDNIEKVVYISSNGNEEITEMIGELYEELMYPAITCVLSKDGTMKSSIISGYKLDICLTDKIYINNDDNTMWLNGANVIIFDHKVMRETYEKILKPLAEASSQRGKHLVCIAPFYDETALSGIIRADLNAEYRKNNQISLVLAVCSKATGYQKVLLDDLAMLLNTQVISPSMETEYLNSLTVDDNIYRLFDFDNRGIDGLNVAVYSDKENRRLSLAQYHDGLDNIFDMFDKERGTRVGYCSELNLGLKESTFKGFYYDENMYNKYMNVAKEELKETQKKCEKIGTFSLDLMQKQQRVYALGLKTGIIEVGSTSEISQGYLKDAVDDAVKAAASAYNNGVVLGCNVTLLRAISKTFQDTTYEEISNTLLMMLMNGFKSVYKTVLNNIFKDSNFEYEHITDSDIDKIKLEIEKLTGFTDISFDKKTMKELLSVRHLTSIHDIIIEYSVFTNTVFDVTTGKFVSDVINSSETDKEILKATIDLLSLLITGNQLVLC